MARRLLLMLLTLWAAATTYIVCFCPNIALALNNRILRRESAQGQTFLSDDNGPEGFVAFGNETYVFCARPCTVEEVGPEDQQEFTMCDSQWEGRKHLCSARFWPGRQYIVQGKRFGRAPR
jgi:hypothetical protein